MIDWAFLSWVVEPDYASQSTACFVCHSKLINWLSRLVVRVVIRLFDMSEGFEILDSKIPGLDFQVSNIGFKKISHTQ